MNTKEFPPVLLIVRKQDCQLNSENMAVLSQGVVCTNLLSLQKIEDCHYYAVLKLMLSVFYLKA